MLRWKPVLIVSLFALVLPLTAHADNNEILGGSFAFTHPPVNPEVPDGVCFDPQGVPLGLRFSVESESFDGVIVTNKETPFTGSGDATGCAFFEPIDGVAAEFTGSFAWQTASGELRGNFELLDFPTEFEGVFAAVVFITFDGGTGRFKKASGTAIAQGLDFPFGGLGGDPFAAGVAAELIAGEIRIK